MLQMSSNSSTALRMQEREVVSIFGAGYSGYNLTAGVPNAPKMEAESKGGETSPSWYTPFGMKRKKFSVLLLYLLSWLVLERGGATSHRTMLLMGWVLAPGQPAWAWMRSCSLEAGIIHH